MTKQTSRILKGICGFLIVCTHVFGFYASNSDLFKIQIGSYVLEDILSRVCDIAVYIFAFISGYGLFKSYEGKSNKELFTGTVTKILKFLLAYWAVVFVLFVPSYCIKNNGFDFLETLKTMFGHHGFFSYGWYVYFYLLVLITLPFTSRIFRNNWILNLLIPTISGVVVYAILLLFGKNYQYYNISCVIVFAYTVTLLGCAFAKTDLFKKDFLKKNLILEICLLVVGLLVELIGYGIIRKAFIQIFSSILILYPIVRWLEKVQPNKIAKVFEFLGDNSGNIWYIHSLFFASYTVELMKITELFKFINIPVIACLVIYIMSLVISIPFYFLNKKAFSKISFNVKRT